MNESGATVVFVEHVLWEPGRDWELALEHLATRFARSAPLDAAAVRARPDFAGQVAALRDWSQEADIDLDRELGRWFDEHLAMHVRPDPALTRAIRALASSSSIHVATALGARSGESLVRHAGCWRSVSQLHPHVIVGPSLDATIADIGGDARVVATVDDLID